MRDFTGLLIKFADGGSQGIDPRVLGGLGGAAVGGIAGALLDRKRRMRGVILGMLGGGAAGFGLGAQHRYLFNKETLDAESRRRQEASAADEAGRQGRIRRRDEIAARLASEGISDVFPYGDGDYELDDFSWRANEAIASRGIGNKLLGIITPYMLDEMEDFSVEGREKFFSIPEIKRSYDNALPRIKQLHDSMDKLKYEYNESHPQHTLYEYQDQPEWKRVRDEWSNLRRAPLSAFLND